MRSYLLIIVSIVLLLLGIVVSLVSIYGERVDIVTYNYSKVAEPPINWRDSYWSIIVYGYPNATIITSNNTIELDKVVPYEFSQPTKYVYIVSGVIQPYAFLSPLALFLVLTGTFIGFKGTIVVFQERVLGKELARGYAVGGSLSRYFLKRLSSFMVSLALIIAIVVVLENIQGRELLNVIRGLLFFNLGVSSYYGISVTSLVLVTLAYTSLLIGITFALTVYISAFLIIYGITHKKIRSVIEKWKYIGTALASWVLSLMIIYGFHFFLNILPYGIPKYDVIPYLIMPTLSLFFPYVGILSNKVISTVKDGTFDYKGLKSEILVYRHVLGNITVVMLSSISSAFIEMLLAEMMIEGIFLWPGIGELAKIAVQHGDFRIIEGILLIYSTIALVSNLITDVIYGALDPRVTR